MNPNDESIIYRLMAAGAKPLQDDWNAHSCVAIPGGFRHASNWHVGQRFGVHGGDGFGHVTNKWISKPPVVTSDFIRADTARHLLQFELTWRDAQTNKLVRQTGVQDVFAAPSRFFWIPDLGELLALAREHAPKTDQVEVFGYPNDTWGVLSTLVDSEDMNAVVRSSAEAIENVKIFGTPQRALIAFVMSFLGGWAWDGKKKRWYILENLEGKSK